MTFTDKFDYLKGTYGEKADFSHINHNFACEITLTDEDCGGTFYIAYINKIPAIEPYDYNDNTVSICIDSITLENMLKGDEDAVKAYLEGKFTLEGNTEHALEMIKCLKKKKRKISKQ